MSTGTWVTLGIFVFTTIVGFIGFLVRQLILKPIGEIKSLLKDYPAEQREHQLMFKAWEQEAMDAIRLLSNPNPHPKRMHDLLNKFTDSVTGGSPMSTPEVSELVELLQEAISDKSLSDGKHAQASKALRFIEARTGAELVKV